MCHTQYCSQSFKRVQLVHELVYMELRKSSLLKTLVLRVLFNILIEFDIFGTLKFFQW